jgi:F0F1-type ATP synthase membrane subunit b/b'
MADDQIDKLEKKKQELQQELHQIQDELDNSIDQVRDDVSSSLDPKKIIQKYPLPIVGASALLGFLLGHRGRSTDKSSSAGEYSSALLAELKRLATRKAISFATDYVEDLLEEKAEKHLTSDNGEGED